MGSLWTFSAVKLLKLNNKMAERERDLNRVFLVIKN
jgi:hypothetical protein